MFRKRRYKFLLDKNWLRALYLDSLSKEIVPHLISCVRRKLRVENYASKTARSTSRSDGVDI